MEQFISEIITPGAGHFDTQAMGRGEPGLPAEYTWRDHTLAVSEKLAAWKHTSAEGGQAGGEVYLRRHYYELRMSDGATWVVYFVRQTPRSGAARQRWFLYTISD